MRTAYTFDPTHVEHSAFGHPEHKGRLDAVWAMMQETGLADRLPRLATPEAPLEFIRQFHSARYIEHVHYMVHQGLSYLDPDTYCTQHSLEVALRAVGALTTLTDAVATRQVDNGMALVRPPGHHAMPHTAMGFCLFGNVALAANHARQKHGVERILIMDFDVHHGNGTQAFFYDDPNVLVCSVHGGPPFWPNTGLIHETGTGDGTGATVNIPLPFGVGDDGYRLAFDRVFTPIANRFKPEMVFLAAGFDAHWMDPMGQNRLSTRGYNYLLKRVMEWADQHANGRLVVALEGGYSPEVLAHSVKHTFALLENPTTKLEDPYGPSPEHGYPIASLIADLVDFWQL